MARDLYFERFAKRKKSETNRMRIGFIADKSHIRMQTGAASEIQVKCVHICCCFGARCMNFGKG